MDSRSVTIFENNRAAVLNEAACRFGFEASNLKKLGSFESFVYEYEESGQAYILKITHSLHRTKNLILGELEWTNYLVAHDVPVCRAIESKAGNFVEVIDVDGSYFLAYVVAKAPGERIKAGDCSDSLIETWGQVTARMHTLAKDYTPSTENIRRHHWYDDKTIVVENYLPAEQTTVIETANRLKAKLRQYPTSRDAYGLIHSDLHHGNFFVDNGRMTVFDWDDCHYNWFAYDIAIPVLYMLLDSAIGQDNIEYASHFMSYFMNGYRRENTIDRYWMSKIPDFLKLREIDLYSVVYAEEAFELNDWCRHYMDGRQQRIERGVPVIDLDFTKF
jgi:Ser/Thr protein kinase RdoA (MazF antagonist)